MIVHSLCGSCPAADERSAQQKYQSVMWKKIKRVSHGVSPGMGLPCHRGFIKMAQLPVCILVGSADMIVAPYVIAAQIDLALAFISVEIANVGRGQGLPFAHHGIVARRTTQRLGGSAAAP